MDTSTVSMEYVKEWIVQGSRPCGSSTVHVCTHSADASYAQKDQPCTPNPPLIPPGGSALALQHTPARAPAARHVMLRSVGYHCRPFVVVVDTKGPDQRENFEKKVVVGLYVGALKSGGPRNYNNHSGEAVSDGRWGKKVSGVGVVPSSAGDAAATCAKLMCIREREVRGAVLQRWMVQGKNVVWKRNGVRIVKVVSRGLAGRGRGARVGTGRKMEVRARGASESPLIGSSTHPLLDLLYTVTEQSALPTALFRTCAASADHPTSSFAASPRTKRIEAQVSEVAEVGGEPVYSMSSGEDLARMDGKLVWEERDVETGHRCDEGRDSERGEDGKRSAGNSSPVNLSGPASPVGEGDEEQVKLMAGRGEVQKVAVEGRKLGNDENELDGQV
ncbi:hypothetical protein C8R45DRAFT_1081618 [Mycena sanguinolenta]|nr:hypothetical protein C8R45DRAFT_1081618 [Mycena sanguinolenta]